MNFIFFMGLLILWYICFWNFVFAIISIPNLGVVFLSNTLDNVKNKILKKLRNFFLIHLSVIFSILIPSFVYAGFIGVYTIRFSNNATNPIIYFIIGGIFSVFMFAPSGESGLINSGLSLVFYILTIKFTSLKLVMGSISTILLDITLVILGGLLVFFLIIMITSWINSNEKKGYLKISEWLRWIIFLPLSLITSTLISLLFSLFISSNTTFYIVVDFINKLISTPLFLYLVYLSIPRLKQNILLILIFITGSVYIINFIYYTIIHNIHILNYLDELFILLISIFIYFKVNNPIKNHIEALKKIILKNNKEQV